MPEDKTGISEWTKVGLVHEMKHLFSDIPLISNVN